MGCVLSYTIQSGKPIYFPIQEPIESDPKLFLRTDFEKNHTEVLACPEGFLFEKSQMKCIMMHKPIEKSIFLPVRNVGICPVDLRGLLPDPMSCRSFYNCWDGRGYHTDCDQWLTFNKDVNTCDFPEEANCCEYWELDPSILVKKNIG